MRPRLFFLGCLWGLEAWAPAGARAQVIVTEKVTVRAPFVGVLAAKEDTAKTDATAAAAATPKPAVFDGTKVVPFYLKGAAFAAPAAGVAKRVVRVTSVTKTVNSVRTTTNGEGDTEEPKKVEGTAPAVLRWNNGESLPGEIGAATEAEFTWKTPLFQEPLALAWSALHRVDQPGGDRLPDGPFAFTLRDGSHLYGDLAGLTADHLTLHGDAHGDVTLRRAEVLSVRRVKGGRLVFNGPWGNAGWTEPHTRESRRNNASQSPPETLGKVPTTATGPGGTLVLPFFNRAAYLKTALPEHVDAEFHVSATERPAFSLALESATGRLRVETWGDQLVLAAGDGFRLIRTLDAAEREVALRVCWDTEARQCRVYTSAGGLLLDWAVPEDNAHQGEGVTLLNRGRNLVLDFLRVRAGDGQQLAATDLAQPRVLLDDGSVIAGSASTLEAGELLIPPAAGGEGPPVRVPLADVDAVGLAGGAAFPAETAGATLGGADGTFLRGQITGIKDGEMVWQTAFADAPLPVKTDTLRQLFLRVPAPAGTPPEPPLKTLDRLVLEDRTLHGKLVATGDPLPHWLPVGGTRAATPSRTLPSEIVRAVAPGQEPPGGTSLLYTRTGDALPGVLHGMDRQEIEFDSPIIAAKSLPAADVDAVQFDVAAGGSVHGFDAPGWRVLKGAKETVLQGDKLNLVDGSSVGHSSVMGNGEVRFTYDTTNYSCLRLRMFCDPGDPTKGTNYILFQMGSTMSTGLEAADGQFSNQNRVSVKNGPVEVRLVTDESSVHCFLNGVLTEAVPVPAAKRAGAGLVLEPTSMWGNQVQAVTLSGFSATAEPGQAFLPAVNADAKAQALTVPRFRKEDPPRQALLATNGDLLRGEIEAITNTQFGFRVGLEELHVPRDRVKAVVTLQKPSEGAPPSAPEEDAVHKALSRTMNQRFWYTRANLQILISVLEREAPELKFKLPTGVDERYAQYHFEAQTVGDNLDGICEQFGLRYQIENGMIVISERESAPPTDCVRVAYWLKPGSLDGKDPAQAQLAAKGVPFAAGGSATWQADSQCLEVVNTPENQAKTVEVLNRDFGGVLGSPTHWVRLTNGGRLGLTVEAFGPDAVRGTHPLYGQCTVPLAQVYAVRNTLPAPTAARRAVDRWQLVYAPEPVLPESGGEGSALLGKAAPTFKLKMLGGGDDFDLAKEKGHVVVLDFWATWCGPCIRSLPGMIETMAQFPADQVKFVGLDQAEAPEQVKRFLETRGWKLAVALDAGQNVARQYGVDGIPHTVIVGPDGKVAWVKTGYTEDGDAQGGGGSEETAGPGGGDTSSSGRGKCIRDGWWFGGSKV